MDKGLSEKINADIERYRKALWYFAQVCDWESFQTKAARLFAYLVSVELSLIKRKLYQMATRTLAAFAAALVIFTILGSAGAHFFLKYRDLAGLIALAGCVFELLLLAELKFYLKFREAWNKRRKGEFVKNIERDFKELLGTHPCGAQSVQEAPFI